jgi:hypothetical protein
VISMSASGVSTMQRSVPCTLCHPFTIAEAEMKLLRRTSVAPSLCSLSAAVSRRRSCWRFARWRRRPWLSTASCFHELYILCMRCPRQACISLQLYRPERTVDGSDSEDQVMTQNTGVRVREGRGRSPPSCRLLLQTVASETPFPDGAVPSRILLPFYAKAGVTGTQPPCARVTKSRVRPSRTHGRFMEPTILVGIKARALRAGRPNTSPPHHL